MKTQSKNKLSQAFNILRGELSLNSPILIIELIICAALLFIFASTCYSAVTADTLNATESLINYIMPTMSTPSAANIFVSSYTGLLVSIGSIFTIIFMAKSLSYLHNKRKLDMYGSMPISRKVFFSSKLVATFIQSTAIIFAFYVVTIIIGLCTGATFKNFEIQYLFIYLFFTLFTVAFYGLCAVCSKGTLGAVVSYFIITIAIPTVAGLGKAIFTGFFVGVNTNLFSNNFVGSVFSPKPETSLFYIIAWVLLSAGCVLLANNIVKYRNFENTRKRLATPLLEYIIKITLTVIFGTFSGLLNGIIYYNNGAVGFIVGFLIVGISTYIVVHIIYNGGFKKMLRSSIVLAVLMAVCVGAFLLCDMNPMGYNNTVPNAENVVSAGYIRTANTSVELNSQTIFDSIGDFTEEKDIENIVEIHNELATNQPKYTTSGKLANVAGSYFINLFFGDINHGLYSQNYIIISYKYDNGMIGSYKYPVDVSYNDDYYSIYNNEEICDTMAEVEITDTYVNKYRTLFTDTDDILCVEVSGIGDEDSYSFYETYSVDCAFSGSTTRDKLFCKDLTNAFIKDFENDKNRVKNCKPFWEYTNHEFSLETLEDKYIVCFQSYKENFYTVSSADCYYIPRTYTECMKVLKEYNVINDDYTINYNSELYNYDFA